MCERMCERIGYVPHGTSNGNDALPGATDTTEWTLTSVLFEWQIRILLRSNIIFFCFLYIIFIHGLVIALGAICNL